MQGKKLTLLAGIIFITCCSMSQCKEDKTPGPETTVRGFVKEAKTGKPLANIQLQIVKTWSSFLTPGRYSAYDITTTSADGSYNLKFIPLGKGVFNLEIINQPIYYFGGVPERPFSINQGLTLGTTDTLNFFLTKALNVQVHLKNDSSHNRAAFHVFILNGNDPYNIAYSDDGIGHVVIDTVINYRLPQLSNYIFQSLFYNPVLSGPNIGTFNDTLSFKKPFYLGTADTAFTIENH